MVQGIVARMAGNSAQTKTWTVSLVTAVFVFSGLSDDPHWLVAAGGVIPVVAFGALDARYLHLERCYVKLHEALASGGEVASFNLDYRPYATAAGSVWKVAWSWSVGGFYGPLLMVILLLVAILAT